jgi:molybdopterin-guanine dinucleotide biosynthesis protein MobB
VKRLHIVGGKDHGKTALVVELVQEFVRRGVPVGTIKHTHHHHELDVPGKDSHRHRQAGAAAVGILSPSMSAIFLPAGKDDIGETDRYAIFAPVFSHCRLVLVEGDSLTDAPKIEVWRSELETAPLAAGDESILAVVTDDLPALATEVLSRSDVVRLAIWIFEQVLGESSKA